MLLLPNCPVLSQQPLQIGPLLLRPSPGEPPSPGATILVLDLQFGGATKPFLHFTGTFGEGTRWTAVFLATYH